MLITLHFCVESLYRYQALTYGGDGLTTSVPLPSICICYPPTWWTGYDTSYMHYASMLQVYLRTLLFILLLVLDLCFLVRGLRMLHAYCLLLHKESVHESTSQCHLCLDWTTRPIKKQAEGLENNAAITTSYTSVPDPHLESGSVCFWAS
jgi:hypothetical protein